MISQVGFQIVPIIMAIYTTEDNFDMRMKCIHRQYGQLGNKNLYPALTMNQSLSRPLKCEDNGIWDRRVIRCTGDISIQDYTPRNLSFLFGSFCFRGFWPKSRNK